MIDTCEKLPTTITQIDEIVHIADIHIRLTKRHEEYREVFSKVYAEINKTSQNTLVVIAGDVFHSKVDLSPEAVQLASEFFKGVADLRPTIIVAGNHDSLLTNTTRLDSISPIVDALNHKSLFYLKETKLYSVGNILINNMSIFTDHTRFINLKDVTKKILHQFDTKIALFHGGVFNAKTDIGYTVTNKSITNNMFDGHDMALLGDIHLAQDLQMYDPSIGNPIIRYAGSLVMQNHGEALTGHGLTLWDVKSRTYKHIEIPNDYGYYTIDIVEGKLVSDITTMPKKPRLRVRCKESVATEVKRIVAEIRKSREISDLIYVRVDGDGAAKVAALQSAANVHKISDVEYQNSLISEHLKAKYAEVMDDATLTAVHEINKTLNAELTKDDQSRSIRWKPMKFEFSNMFSYGEDNVVDFTKLADVYGLFAANASGKSSLMDALCFTIFDKSARAFKASHVINSQKMSFRGKFTFEINNVTYTIERSGTRDKKGNVKVDVNFYKMEKGEQVSLNSEARRSTNEIIRDYLGSYDEFVLTSLALQGNQGSFIDMGQTDRKDLLAQFIGLNMFDTLASRASDALKEISGAIKLFNKGNNQEKLLQIKSDIEIFDEKIRELAERRDFAAKEKSEVEAEIDSIKSKIIVLENVPANIDDINIERSSLLRGVESGSLKLKTLTENLEAVRVEIDAMRQTEKQYADLNLVERVSAHSKLMDEKVKCEHELATLKTVVAEKLKKLAHLDKHEYDPNCKYCCNNIFVKDAISTRESLAHDKVKAKEMLANLEELSKKISELEPFVAQYKHSTEIKNKLSQQNVALSKQELEKVTLLSKLENARRRISEIDGQIELYDRSKEVIETNKGLTASIKKLETQLSVVLAKAKAINKEYVDAYSRRVSLSDQQKSIEEQIEKIQKYEDEQGAYQYYLSAIGKDGVPYRIISDAVPKIEQEANNILSQIVEFSMGIETDGKNVNVYIKYEDRKWPLELCSGMEKFVAALALRVALINISNMPRANFLAVDEGFGALDATNMTMVHSLFDYLKTNFDFIIVISHLDAMRDMVDKQLEIKKVDGFSKIDNSV